MTTRRQQFGRKAEAIAMSRLKQAGYKIIDQNFRTRIGEIDIIAKDGPTIVFVEVKARRTSRYGHPKQAVTPAKQRKISMVALEYLKSTGQNTAKARFDVVAVTAMSYDPKIEIIKNAFELAYP
jgi:putative endonuclease